MIRKIDDVTSISARASILNSGLDKALAHKGLALGHKGRISP